MTDTEPRLPTVTVTRDNGHPGPCRCPGPIHDPTRHGDTGILHRVAEAGIRALIGLTGEDPDRPGLEDTPGRVVRAVLDMTNRPGNPAELLARVFGDAGPVDEMITVGPVEFASLCIPSNQLVNVVGGARRARNVAVGDQLWTLHQGKVVPTNVVHVSTRRSYDLVEVETDAGTFQCTADHPFATPTGWVEAGHLNGFSAVEWTNQKALHRDRYPPRTGYQFGYAIGSITADGTVGKRWVSLVVNDKDYAERFARSLEHAFGVNPNVEAVSRPSGFTGRDTRGFRVRVVSSYLADLLRMYVGGDAHHMRQGFPRVVMADEETFAGFLDGYIDGDGYRPTGPNGRWSRYIVSGNQPFLRDLQSIVGGSIGTMSSGCYRLGVADSWMRKHGFRQEDHRTDLAESDWTRVRRVTRVGAPHRHPFKVYSFMCEPYPTFLVGGHLSHNCEHHMLPFTGHAWVSYVPNDHVIVGLSKLARLVEHHAHRLQVQERMTNGIADDLMTHLTPKGCGVRVAATHSCMAVRGVRKPGALMTTTALRGVFYDQPETRAEFLTATHQSRYTPV